MYCSWELKLLFHLKNISLFFLFLPSTSLLSSFFLLIFFSLPHLLSISTICSGSSSSSLICSGFIFIAIPRSRPISPSPPSHRRSMLHCWPKLHQHRLHWTQERRGFCGWISWVSLGFVMAVWFGFMGQWWYGYVGSNLCGGFWLIWIFGSGCEWLFLAC